MEPKDFIINVGPNGTFRPSGIYQTLPEHIDAIFENFTQKETKKIVIYFHGGLVNEKTGMETAIKMGKHIEDAEMQPICFVWETGLKETLSANITKITDTKLFNKLVKVLVKKLSEKLGFDLISTRGSGSTLNNDEIDEELFSPKPFESFSQNVHVNFKDSEAISNLPENEEDLIRFLEADFRYLIDSDPDFLKAIEETKLAVNSEENPLVQEKGIISAVAFAKHVAMIAFRVIKRFINKRDHDFYPTLIEEILRELYVADLGAWVWNNMKIKSNEMWNSNEGITGLNQFAGRYLLEKLIDYAKDDDTVTIDLVGHSAGSIAICNLLKTTASICSDKIYNKIAFMAPACRIDLFNNEIVKKTERFNKFRMYTMNNELECGDLLVPYFYTHSLLYLISGILEGEGKEFDAYILGMERHLLNNHPYDKVSELIETNKYLFQEDTNRIVFSPMLQSALGGFRTQSISHGGFDDDEKTIESIKFFLNEA